MAAGARLRAALAEARYGVRVRRRRALLTALGIALAAAMLSAAIVVSTASVGASTAPRAPPSSPTSSSASTPSRPIGSPQRIEALPDVAAFSLRQELTNVDLSAGDHCSCERLGRGGRPRPPAATRSSPAATVGPPVRRGRRRAGARRGVGDPPRGRARHRRPRPAAGRRLLRERPTTSPTRSRCRACTCREAALEPGGSAASVESAGQPRPDLAARPAVPERGARPGARDSYGLQDLQFVTRSGVRVLLDQAAGIVIDLLVALSLIALVTAAVMLAASARAEVQRRLRAIGVRRAVGASRGHLALTQALEATLIAAPAATLGVLAGDARHVRADEPAADAAQRAGAGARAAGARSRPLGRRASRSRWWRAAWPAWRAAGRSPVGAAARRRARRAASRRARRSRRRPRVARARGSSPRAARAGSPPPPRSACRPAFVLLMLALASALSSARDRPGGARQALPAHRARCRRPPPPACARIPGVQAVAPRYEVQAVDSFSLGETIDVIAYPGDHTRVRGAAAAAGTGRAAPPGRGRRRAWPRRSGSIPARRSRSSSSPARELRLRVAGVVSSLDHDGRVAYVPAAALLAADPSAPEELAVALQPGANATAVEPTRLGASAAAGHRRDRPRRRRSSTMLRSILRAVAIVDGLVCLYALIQACALTRPGAPADRRGPARVRRRRRRGPAAARRRRARARDPRGRARGRARAARARPGAVATGRELRDAAARRERAGVAVVLGGLAARRRASRSSGSRGRRHARPSSRGWRHDDRRITRRAGADRRRWPAARRARARRLRRRGSARVPPIGSTLRLDLARSRRRRRPDVRVRASR